MAELSTGLLDPVSGLLSDLDTITTIAAAGIRAPDSALEPGETRPCAILYLDIVGFTDLARVLGPEELARLVDRTLRIFEVTVNGAGGYCDKIIGDAALYVFPGHPHHAPACQAALHSALGLLRRLAQVNQSLQPVGLSLDIRVGVSFGLVTRQRVGGAAQQVTVMGEVVNLAQRLEAAAQPGSICTVAEVVAETDLLFDFDSLGLRDLKGFGPTELFSLQSAKPLELRLRGAGALSPLTGRTRLLSSAEGLIQAWLADRGAAGRLLLLQGPTAVGKSRTALELLRRLRADAPALRSCTVHCTPQRGLLNLAADLCGIGDFPEGGTAARWSELCRCAGPEPPERLERGGLMLAYLLQDPAAETALIGRMDSASFLAECVQTLKLLFTLAAAEAGGNAALVIVAEDLQWSGRLAELLQPLLQAGALPCPLIVVATARPGYDAATEMSALLPAVAGDAAAADPPCEVLQVEPISAAEGADLFSQLLPGIDLPPAIEAELHEKSLGLPYYYEEMARLLLRRGVVRQVLQDGQVACTLTEPLRALELPSDFRMLILGRMDLLEPELRETASHASVLGRSFHLRDYAELEQRLGGPAEDELAAHLSALAGQRILVSGDGEQYFFEHILTHEAVYSALLSGNRRSLHSAAAELTAARHLPGTAAEWEVLPELVRHLEGAGRYGEACEKCCDLLQLMARNQRFEEWEEWEQRAESWLSSSGARMRPNFGVGYLYWVQGLKLMQHSQLNLPERLLQRALHLSKGIDPNAEARILMDLGFLHFSHDDFSMAEGFFEAALIKSRELGIEELEGEAEYHLGRLFQRRGQIANAIEAYSRVLPLFSSTSVEYRIPALLNTLGSCHVDQEDFDSAIEFFTEAKVRARRFGNHKTECAALGNLGVAWHGKGDLPQALDAYSEALAKTQEMGWRRAEAFNLMNIGDLQFEQGKLLLARDSLEAACKANLEVGAEWANGITYGTLGEVHTKLSNFEEARIALEQAEKCLRGSGDSFRRGLIQCSWVRYHLAINDFMAAEAALERARALILISGNEENSSLGRAILTAERELENVRQGD